MKKYFPSRFGLITAILLIILLITDLVLLAVNNIDSDKDSAPNIAEVRRLNKQCEINVNQGNLDSALYYSQAALDLGLRTEFLEGVAAAYNGIGVVCDEMNYFTPALSNYRKSIVAATQAGDIRSVAIAHNSIGILYKNRNELDSAEYHFLQAQRVSNTISYDTGTASAFDNLGLTYALQKDTARARRSFETALSIYQKIGAKTQQGFVLANIANLDRLQMPEKSRALDSMALNILDHSGGDIIKTTGLHMNVANIEADFEFYELALNEFLRCRAIFDSLHYGPGSALCNVNIGSVYAELGQSELGIIYTQRGLDSLVIYGNQNYITGAYKTLSDIYDSINDCEKAFENYIAYTARLSALAEQNRIETERFISTFTEYQVASEQRIKDQKGRKEKTNLCLFIVLIAIIALGAALFWGRNRRLKFRYWKTLLNIFPRTIAAEVAEDRKPDPKKYKSATVLFTDFVGFTTYAEKVAPETLVRQLDIYFMKFDQIIRRHGLEKIKTIGDAYMAVGGLPQENTSHPFDTVAAAKDILRFVESYKSQTEFPFDIKVGIHTGHLIAGIVGTHKYQYDIWGDTVNIAARMEQKSEKGQINISEELYNIIKAEHKCIYRGEIEAKNKAKLKMYFVDTANETARPI